MSIFNKKVTDMNNGTTVDYDLKPGMHQAVCVGVCYMPDQEVEYKGEKKIQNTIQLYFAAKEGDAVKTIFSRKYKLSFHETAGLVKDMKNWQIKIDSLEDFLGKTCSLVVAKQDKYTNIISILPPQGETTIDLSKVFIPKFWMYTDKEMAQKTTFEYITKPEVVERKTEDDE